MMTVILASASHRNNHSVWPLREDARSGPRRARRGDSVTSEAALAWELADTVSVCFAAHDNLGIYTALGADETYVAIERMLDIAARKRYPLPAGLLRALAAWLDCYVGDDHEPTIRSLLNRIEPQALRTTVPRRRGNVLGRPSSSRTPTLIDPPLPINTQGVAETNRDRNALYESPPGSRLDGGQCAGDALAEADNE
jgi:hypothetical protein